MDLKKLRYNYPRWIKWIEKISSGGLWYLAMLTLEFSNFQVSHKVLQNKAVFYVVQS